MRHIIPISGKDSLTTAIIQTARENHDYEYFFNPTGLELPEVFTWLDMIEKELDITIVRVGKPLKDIIKSTITFYRLSRSDTAPGKVRLNQCWNG
jgi:3'-phosphoadenosine 5'-phosphosulfate sulfotransferase (PAPS reductase)/FAD synthetase